MQRVKRLLFADLRDGDGMAEGGVISKEKKRIFQKVGEIIDENEKKHRAKNAALRNSRKRG